MSDLLAGVLSCSTECHMGAAEDTFGKAAVEACESAGLDVVAYDVCPNDVECIEASLVEMCDVEEAHVVVTVGGIGMGEHDVTPEASRAAITREMPGIAEAMRAATSAGDARMLVTRGVAGQRGRTLVANIPACEGPFEASLEWLLAHVEALVSASADGS